MGDLHIDDDGIATRGLLVRHLVLPHGLAGTGQIVEFLAGEVSSNTYLNVMAQYRPCHKAYDFPALSKAVTMEEYLDAVTLALQHGLTRLDQLCYPRMARASF